MAKMIYLIPIIGWIIGEVITFLIIFGGTRPKTPKPFEDIKN